MFTHSLSLIKNGSLIMKNQSRIHLDFLKLTGIHWDYYRFSKILVRSILKKQWRRERWSIGSGSILARVTATDVAINDRKVTPLWCHWKMIVFSTFYFEMVMCVKKIIFILIFLYLITFIWVQLILIWHRSNQAIIFIPFDCYMEHSSSSVTYSCSENLG